MPMLLACFLTENGIDFKLKLKSDADLESASEIIDKI